MLADLILEIEKWILTRFITKCLHSLRLNLKRLGQQVNIMVQLRIQFKMLISWWS